MTDYYHGPEAEEWMRNNKNRNAFAGNRFSETRDALATVLILKKKFHAEVEVAGILDEPSRIHAQGGPYADTLIIGVPKEYEEDFLFYVSSRLHPDEFDHIRGKKEYRVWWD